MEPTKSKNTFVLGLGFQNVERVGYIVTYSNLKSLMEVN